MKTQTEAGNRVLRRQLSGLGETGLRESGAGWLGRCLALLMCAGLAAAAWAAEPPAVRPKSAVVPRRNLSAVESPAQPAAVPAPAMPAPAMPAPAPPGTPLPGTHATSPADAATLRDPTQVSEQMRAVLGQQVAVQASAPQTRLPSLRIKGRVASAEGAVLVLLEVGEQLERVTADAEWTTNEGLTIKVLSISLSELRLQVEPPSRIVTIR